MPKGKKQYPREITVGQTIDFGSVDILETDHKKRTDVAIDPSTRPVAGSPSNRLKGTVNYKPNSSYGHILVPNYSSNSTNI